MAEAERVQPEINLRLYNLLKSMGMQVTLLAADFSAFSVAPPSHTRLCTEYRIRHAYNRLPQRVRTTLHGGDRFRRFGTQNISGAI